MNSLFDDAAEKRLKNAIAKCMEGAVTTQDETLIDRIVGFELTSDGALIARIAMTDGREPEYTFCESFAVTVRDINAKPPTQRGTIIPDESTP